MPPPLREPAGEHGERQREGQSDQQRRPGDQPEPEGFREVRPPSAPQAGGSASNV